MIKKRSKVLFEIKNRTILKRLFLHLNKKRIERLSEGEDKTNLLAKYYFNYKFDCKNPRTFNECLCWLKHNYRNPLWSKCADKIQAKEFLCSLGLGKYIPKTLCVYKNVNDVDLSKLPDEFVLKTNHDCGSVFICKKGITNFEEVLKQINASLTKQYNVSNSEWVYENIKPLIFAEELLKSPNGELKDYKIQTIGGKYIFGYVLSNKTIDERHELFESDFEFADCFYQSLSTPKKKRSLKPKQFDEMIQAAETIGKHFLEVRVDFYITTHGIKIGELTFFTQSGFGRFTKKEFDFKYGRYLINAISKETSNK